MKNRPVRKKKRTPTEQGRHDRRVMTGLLLVIAVLLGAVIALLPDRSSNRVIAVDPGSESSAGEVPEDKSDAPSREDRESREGREGESPSTGEQPTETYPPEEPPPDRPADEDSTPWWLPAPAEGVTPGTLYLVLDDAGGSLMELEPFLSLDVPVTIAVLPQLPYSAESAFATVTAGQEVILHQPMEPVGGGDPGPGAITASTPPESIPQLIRGNLATVPGAVGVNNHMGSLITQDVQQMRSVLRTLESDNLFFLDSRTSAQTVAATVAREIGLPFAERHVFLDNDRDRDAILQAFRGGFERARAGDDTILIGHVTVAQLAEVIVEVGPLARSYGYQFGHLSEAIQRSSRISEGHLE